MYHAFVIFCVETSSDSSIALWSCYQDFKGDATKDVKDRLLVDWSAVSKDCETKMWFVELNVILSFHHWILILLRVWFFCKRESHPPFFQPAQWPSTGVLFGSTQEQASKVPEPHGQFYFHSSSLSTSAGTTFCELLRCWCSASLCHEGIIATSVTITVLFLLATINRE